MFSKEVSESIRIAMAIANSLGDRYYDVGIVGDENEAFVEASYNVWGSEHPWQDGLHVRIIRVFNGRIEADVDDYFESVGQESEFYEVMAAFSRHSSELSDYNAGHMHEPALADEDIPF